MIRDGPGNETAYDFRQRCRICPRGRGRGKTVRKSADADLGGIFGFQAEIGVFYKN